MYIVYHCFHLFSIPVWALTPRTLFLSLYLPFRQSNLVLVEMSRLLSLICKFAVYVQAGRKRKQRSVFHWFSSVWVHRFIDLLSLLAEAVLLLLSATAQPHLPFSCRRQGIPVGVPTLRPVNEKPPKQQMSIGTRK